MVPPEPEPTPVPEKPVVVATPAPEDPDMTWEDKEDKEGKMDAENTKPDPNNPDKKYQYKEGGSLNLELPSYLSSAMFALLNTWEWRVLPDCCGK